MNRRLLTNSKSLIVIVLFNYLLFSAFAKKQSLAVNTNYESSSPPIQTPRFEDPATAYQILDQLDIYEQIDITKEELATNFARSSIGFRKDDNYCKKVRALFVEYPEVVFEQKNIFISRLEPSAYVRQEIIPRVGGTNIKEPFISERKQDPDGLFKLSENATSIMTFSPIYKRAALGIHFGCLSQVLSVFPGSEHMYKKDLVGEAATLYIESYKSRPQCKVHDRYFPKSYVLYDQEQCKEFFGVIDSPEYEQLKKERGIIYLRKIGAGVHTGKGVFPVNEKEEQYIRKLYQNGAKCGEIKKNNVIQYLVPNPLLLNGNKCDFRVYMLVASVNPLIVYYTSAFIRVSVQTYNSTNTENPSAFLTNFKINRDIFAAEEKDGTYKGYTLEGLLQEYLWNDDRFQAHLLETGVITDPNWLENYLIPEFKRTMIHLVRMTQDKFVKKSSHYQLFGLDFLLDENLNVWFIEANESPGMGYTEDKERLQGIDNRMMVGHYEIVYGLLRSRMKRVIKFVNELIRDKQVEKISEGKVVIKDIESKREEFKRITKNYFEPEYEPSAENVWQPVINENYQGKAGYFDLIREECL